VITRHSLEDLGLEIGTPVVALIKVTALHVFPV
jgi:molybdopterin-binding protein